MYIYLNQIHLRPTEQPEISCQSQHRRNKCHSTSHCHHFRSHIVNTQHSWKDTDPNWPIATKGN